MTTTYISYPYLPASLVSCLDMFLFPAFSIYEFLLVIGLCLTPSLPWLPPLCKFYCLKYRRLNCILCFPSDFVCIFIVGNPFWNPTIITDDESLTLNELTTRNKVCFRPPHQVGVSMSTLRQTNQSGLTGWYGPLIHLTQY